MSFLFGQEEVLRSVLLATSHQYGMIDFLSEPLPFDFTDYYEPEMGSPLWRRIAGFEPLIFPETLPRIKLKTNQLEAEHRNARQGRAVNIDPGYIAASKFILATGKDYSHRLYLGEGIYGDLTLIFREGGYVALPWTYPDYASEPLRGLLNLLRQRYLWQLKNDRGRQTADRSS